MERGGVAFCDWTLSERLDVNCRLLPTAQCLLPLRTAYCLLFYPPIVDMDSETECSFLLSSASKPSFGRFVKAARSLLLISSSVIPDRIMLLMFNTPSSYRQVFNTP